MPKSGFTYIDLFAGIGGFHAALSAMGGECVYAVEIDPAAAAVYRHNWGHDPLGDITQDANDEQVRVPPHDVLVAGFPCQPFSKSGAQRGMDETRGTLYWNILKIIQEHHPAMVLLENVRNLAGPRHAHEWQVIIETLRGEGYRVSGTPAVFSPHLLPPDLGGRPQVRERVFISATYDPEGLGGTEWVLPPIEHRPVDWDPQAWDLESHLPLSADHHVAGCNLTAAERRWIDAWDAWVQMYYEISEGEQPPGFPIWVDEWRTTDELEVLLLDEPDLPAWKVNFLRRNAALYERFREPFERWIDQWEVLTEAFPPSRRKFEWQAQRAPRLWDCVMHFRPSGIRAKRPTYLPALVAITQTSIIGPRERRLSPREAARLQGLPEWFQFPGQSDAQTYRQLGNGVSIGAVWHVLKRHADRDRVILAQREPRLLAAIEQAPKNPDEALTMLTPAHAQFRPAEDKLEAVNRISALTGSGPETLGPGSKERKSLLVNLARGLGLQLDERRAKPALAGQIATSLGMEWGGDCWSTGQTITLIGLNRLLEGAERSLARGRATGLSVGEEALLVIRTLAGAMPSRWDGRRCIEEMRLAGDRNWAQDEWKGFYLEYLAGLCTALGGQRHALRYGKTTIDYLLGSAWDFKVHSDGDAWAPLNDQEAFNACIEDQGGLGFIVVTGERIIEEGFREWQAQERLRHGKKRRATKKEKKQERLGTASFIPTRIQAFHFTAEGRDSAFESGLLKAMQQGNQTTTNRPRRGKYQLNVRDAKDHLLVDFMFPNED